MCCYRLSQPDSLCPGRGAGGITNGSVWPHFGLGDATQADSVIVEWPNGMVDISTDVPADKYYTVEEGSGVLTSINMKYGKNTIPMDYSLDQTYPNPFNASTMINYELPDNGMVKLTIHDITGRLVKTLVNEKQSIGNYKVVFNVENLTSGIYFYTLQAGAFSQMRRMLFVK